MNDKPIEFTHRDRVMRAWQNSMELVRDFQLYAKEMQDVPGASEKFHEFAESQAQQASCLREMLHELS